MDGYANFTIPKAMVLGNVTITRADFAPFEYADLPLDDTYPPYTDYVTTPTLPDGSNNYFKTAPKVRLLPEPGVTTFYRWDSDIDKMYAGEEFTTVEGEHTLRFHSVDWKNNIEGEKSLTFKVDSLVPNTTVNITPAAPDGTNGWYVHVPQVTLSNPGNTGSPARISYKIDVEPDYADYVGTVAIDEGQHTMTFYSRDEAGNREKERTIVFKVDLTPPASVGRITPAKPDG